MRDKYEVVFVEQSRTYKTYVVEATSEEEAERIATQMDMNGAKPTYSREAFGDSFIDQVKKR